MALAAKSSGYGNVTFRIAASVLARLDEYQKKTNVPKESIIGTALENYLNELEEDYADARAGEAAWAEYIASGRKSTSSAELKKELGL